MTNQKHTPGPWEIRKGYTNLFIDGPTQKLDDYATYTPEVAAIHISKYAETHEANASLIAASPDLLDACKEALIEIHQIHSHYLPDCKEGCPSHHVADLLRQAITKAEGRTP